MLRSPLLLAAVLACACGSAHADSARVDVYGPYAALGIGTGVTQHQTDVGGMGSAALGWGFGNGLRLEVQGSRMEASSARTRGDMQQTGAFANVLYDIDLSPHTGRIGSGMLAPLTPYVGAGAGYQWFTRSGGGRKADTDGAFSLQGMVGASYAVSAVPGLSITGEYRVTGVPGDLTVRGERANGAVTHAGLLGLRYAFGGAPAAVLPAATTERDVRAEVLLPARTYLVFFEWDKSNLTARARQIVSEAAQGAQATRSTRLEVSGHADLSGTAQYNEALSRKRADNVAAELVRGGVARESIVVTALGETRPLVPTSDGTREVQNRRVEIVIR